MRDTPVFIAVSGKMFSGKDSLADAIAARLRELGRQVVRLTYSDVICAEAQPGVEVMRRLGHAIPRGELADEVASAVSITHEQAVEFIEAVESDLADPEFTIRSRTPGSRFILQRLGSTWRPDGYWARKVIERCASDVADGKDVVLVGVRLPAETVSSKAAGAAIIRLDVSRPVQIARSLERDGHEPKPEALDHPGETATDGFDFDLRIDTDQLDLTGVQEVAFSWLFGPHGPYATDRH